MTGIAWVDTGFRTREIILRDFRGQDVFEMESGLFEIRIEICCHLFSVPYHTRLWIEKYEKRSADGVEVVSLAPLTRKTVLYTQLLTGARERSQVKICLRVTGEKRAGPRLHWRDDDDRNLWWRYCDTSVCVRTDPVEGFRRCLRCRDSSVGFVDFVASHVEITNDGEMKLFAPPLSEIARCVTRRERRRADGVIDEVLRRPWTAIELWENARFATVTFVSFVVEVARRWTCVRKTDACEEEEGGFIKSTTAGWRRETWCRFLVACGVETCMQLYRTCTDSTYERDDGWEWVAVSSADERVRTRPAEFLAVVAAFSDEALLRYYVRCFVQRSWKNGSLVLNERVERGLDTSLARTASARDFVLELIAREERIGRKTEATAEKKKIIATDDPFVRIFLRNYWRNAFDAIVEESDSETEEIDRRVSQVARNFESRENSTLRLGWNSEKSEVSLEDSYYELDDLLNYRPYSRFAGRADELFDYFAFRMEMVGFDVEKLEEEEETLGRVLTVSVSDACQFSTEMKSARRCWKDGNESGARIAVLAGSNMLKTARSRSETHPNGRKFLKKLYDWDYDLETTVEEHATLSLQVQVCVVDCVRFVDLCEKLRLFVLKT